MVTQQQANTNQAKVVAQRKAMIKKATGGAKLSVPTKKFVTVKTETPTGTTTKTYVQDSPQEAKIKAERLEEQKTQAKLEQAERELARSEAERETATRAKTAGEAVRESREIARKYNLQEAGVIARVSERERAVAERVRPEPTRKPERLSREDVQERIQQEKAQRLGLFGARKIDVGKTVVSKIKPITQEIARRAKPVTKYLDKPSFDIKRTNIYRVAKSKDLFKTTPAMDLPLQKVKAGVGFVREKVKAGVSRVKETKVYQARERALEERDKLAKGLVVKAVKKSVSPETFEFKVKPTVKKAREFKRKTGEVVTGYKEYFTKSPLKATATAGIGLATSIVTRRFPTTTSVSAPTIGAIYTTAKVTEYKLTPPEERPRMIGETGAELTAFGAGAGTISATRRIKVVAKTRVKPQLETYARRVKRTGKLRADYEVSALKYKYSKEFPLPKEAELMGVRGKIATEDIFSRPSTKFQTQLYPKQVSGLPEPKVETPTFKTLKPILPVEQTRFTYKPLTESQLRLLKTKTRFDKLSGGLYTREKPSVQTRLTEIPSKTKEKYFGDEIKPSWLPKFLLGKKAELKLQSPQVQKEKIFGIPQIRLQSPRTTFKPFETKITPSKFQPGIQKEIPMVRIIMGEKEKMMEFNVPKQFQQPKIKSAIEPTLKIRTRQPTREEELVVPQQRTRDRQKERQRQRKIQIPKPKFPKPPKYPKPKTPKPPRRPPKKPPRRRPPKKPPVVKLGIWLPKFKPKSFEPTIKKKKTKYKFGYIPSLWAVAGQIRGKKTGAFGLRPIPTTREGKLL